MASTKGLNPFAAEFVKPQNSSFSKKDYSPPTPLNPYASSFYCFSNVLPAPTGFPSTPITYSLPFPTDFQYPTHFEHRVLPAIQSVHRTVSAQPELVEVQQPAHDLVAQEANQKFVPPKVPRIRGSKGRYRRYSRFFDQQIGRSSTSTEKQEGKPALKSTDEKKLPKKFIDYNWCVPRRMVKRFSNVLPVRKDGDGTTVMIRNIPNKYSRDLLMTFLDKHCANENRKSDGGEESESAFDFLYLPIDFWTGMNKGYAFVNFTKPKAVWKFYLAAHSQTWDSFHSNKIREIAYARIQGKKDLVQHFETMGFPCESEDVLPVCFSPPRNGSEKLVERTYVGKLEGWEGIGLKRQAAGTWRKVKEGSSAKSCDLPQCN
ncbi:putative RNA recognition motif 2, nucleotide-binding alpha-beta plait domain-containing protein [Rosa chinensis]|uniref:Putative RNA recognition motif 2, nucleotide-binding alpha-beta plait domain-containing protein n=1 Tax=Rosa chinensis TaxID=74649 RepID=A0A2P6PPT8_ROSCH|nr:uncharacterized protein LOC112171088 [Rosa chinensis]PRQ23953.1 putative RNA recognition motif 2, nucleotide-binding alpha-beta plait domain-containing protein [Rosa chinensis]